MSSSQIKLDPGIRQAVDKFTHASEKGERRLVSFGVICEKLADSLQRDDLPITAIFTSDTLTAVDLLGSSLFSGKDARHAKTRQLANSAWSYRPSVLIARFGYKTFQSLTFLASLTDMSKECEEGTVWTRLCAVKAERADGDGKAVRSDSRRGWQPSDSQTVKLALMGSGVQSVAE